MPWRKGRRIGFLLATHEKGNGMNPADWGGTPLANGAVRGFLAAVIVGFLYAIYGWQSGQPLDQAVAAGMVPMLLALLSLLGYGIVDQNRANNGVVIASDVPVQIESNIQVAGDTAHGGATPNRRSAQEVAADWNRRYALDRHDR